MAKFSAKKGFTYKGKDYFKGDSIEEFEVEYNVAEKLSREDGFIFEMNKGMKKFRKMHFECY